MSEGRELMIRAIKNGIVIDHIPSEKVFAIVEILKLKEYSERITVATNMPSSSLRRKGIIKIEEKILEEKEKYKCFYCEKVILEDEIQIQ